MTHPPMSFAQRPNAAAAETRIDAAILRSLAERPLFEALAASMRGLRGTRAADLNRDLVLGHTASRRPLRFVIPDDDAIGYELRIHERGEVLTRPDDWHDLFNALVWSRFPRAKAALNAVHVEELRARDPATGRGTRRDAATQFDESGLVVLSSAPALLDLLSARRWVDLFWHRRADVVRSMRFLVFGHALYDALRAPFYGLCGRAALIEVDHASIEAPMDAQIAAVDEVLADRFLLHGVYPQAKCLTPVPVLGIPGVTPASECRTYYEDERQFRLAKAASAAGSDLACCPGDATGKV